ncbi:MAG: hypothetical protein P8M78_06900 [Myxococcota bacterium]|nr:hypothetical protein [Myxococcota bacterium]
MKARWFKADSSLVPFRFGTLLFAAGSVLLGLTVVPELADACTVCTSGQQEESRKAFIGTTAFMTFFPLLMLAVVVGLFVKRTLAQEQEEEAARSDQTVGLDGPRG